MNWAGLKSVIRGLSLLRDPEMIRDLGHRAQHLRVVAGILKQHPTCRVDCDVVLSGFDPARLRLGSRCTIAAGTVLSFGDELNGFGTISIGDETWIGQTNNLRAGGGTIRIGRGCLISQFCTLVASNHGIRPDQPVRTQAPRLDRRGVTLGDDVWLGAGVTVLPGVTIHSGAVIGAGSVVTRDVAAGEIHVGIPARKQGERGSVECGGQGSPRQNPEASTGASS